MHKVHITLQGKGGVGKSLVASLLAQHHLESGTPVVCIDTDPVNATLSGYRAFARPQGRADAGIPAGQPPV